MKKKTYVSGLLIAAVILICTAISATAFASEAAQIEINRKKSAVPSLVSTEMDATMLEAIAEADPNSTVTHSLVTGETSLIEYDASTEAASNSAEEASANGLISAADAQLIKPAAIVKDDNREAVVSTSFPYSATAYLEITYRDGSKATGSGAFVTSNSLLTAGHLIYVAEKGGWPASVKVTPGGTLSGASSVYAIGFATSNAWIDGESREFDRGLVVFDQDVVSNYFTLEAASTDSLLVYEKSTGVYQYGYPSDKTAGTLYRAGGYLMFVSPYQIVFSCDAVAGSDGGPVVKADTTGTIIGIYTVCVKNFQSEIPVFGSRKTP